MISERPTWNASELRASRDVEAVALLSLASADYALLANGEPPSPDDGAGFFSDVAPGKSALDMLKLGVFGEDGPIAGVADVVRFHPHGDDWGIGLLLPVWVPAA